MCKPELQKKKPTQKKVPKKKCCTECGRELKKEPQLNIWQCSSCEIFFENGAWIEK